ncbi:hypothetical protein K503DRAFT_388404 [Rhizopogon vinicolor AM-OR11-026]|uniref:FAD-binding domain-containing protein n=1 Tax=Rhizopogon vinicolor AM-OR11-026 TaxID=1314800 RepID=A0A1B7NBQ6_9AGAM|nr:hypothetical protein K503DRAFT_388404 [Rhizopogon vinicolor AM-OR11-026]
MTPKFRVAICGAGVGGLVLAVTIGKFAERDIQIDIYEAHDAITAVGAGIVTGLREAEIIQELGIYEEYSRVSKPPSAIHGLSKSCLLTLLNMIRTSRATIQEVRYPGGWFQMVSNPHPTGQALQHETPGFCRHFEAAPSGVMHSPLQ